MEHYVYYTLVMLTELHETQLQRTNHLHSFSNFHLATTIHLHFLLYDYVNR